MAGNALPILLIGGAAALMLAGKKKKKKQFPGEILPPQLPPIGKLPIPEPSSGTTYVPIELAYLGYNLEGGKETIRNFQGDYNVVMMYQTNGKAKTFGILLEKDGIIGPRTKDAIATAQDIQNKNGPWPDVVKMAAQKFGES